MSNPAAAVRDAIAPSTTLSRYGDVVTPPLPPNYAARFIVTDLLAALHEAEAIALDETDAVPAFRRMHDFLVARYGDNSFLSAWAADTPGRDR